MAKIGSYEYPDIQFGTLLKALEVLYTKFDGKVTDERTFAEALGHKTNNSGGFLMKLADMRRYGLIDKRGISITEIGKKIVEFLTPDERQEALNQTIIGISLWKALYEKLGVTPDENDFKIRLVQLTGDRDTSIKKSSDIRNLYIDAMTFYSNVADKKVSNNSNDEQKPPADDNNSKPKRDGKVPETLIVLKSGEVDITLPKNDSNIKILKSILDGMIQINSTEK